MITTTSMWAEHKDRVLNGVFNLVGSGGPVSGSAFSISGVRPTGLGVAGYGSRYLNLSNGVEYWNEGTILSPYWTPIDFNHPALLAFQDDFRNGVGEALTATNTNALLARSGIRIHGDGLSEVDSGAVVTFAEDGPILTLTTTDEVNHLVVLSQGDTNPIFQPDRHAPLVADVLFTSVSAITLRRYFLGALGTIADALVSPVTGSTTTLTLVQDDVAGMFMDAALTDAAGIFLPHNKSDEAASIATTATGVDTGYDVEAAATYQRWRIEINSAGVLTAFKNKVQIGQISAALDADEELALAFLIASTSTAVKSCIVKKVAFWGQRNTYLN